MIAPIVNRIRMPFIVKGMSAVFKYDTDLIGKMVEVQRFRIHTFSSE